MRAALVMGENVREEHEVVSDGMQLASVNCQNHIDHAPPQGRLRKADHARSSICPARLFGS